MSVKANKLIHAPTNLVNNVIEGGYCIGCGACAVKSCAYSIKTTEQGFYQAELVAGDTQKDIDEVCPFSSSKDENKIGRKLFEKNSLFDSRVGYYKQIYAGHVEEKEYRQKGSSGGLVTWVLSELLSAGKIDGVIHVGETGRKGELFEYRISETLDEIRLNAKSRYYPVHMDEVIRKIKQTDKVYAFVGVPCFVKSIRLLMESDNEISARIKYCIAIFCGHFKTKAFSEMIAWQQNVLPHELAGIDFRVKVEGRRASQYGAQVIKQTSENGKIKLPPVQKQDLYGMDWGLGYFKPKACDWCDDIAGEVADLTCGDAWLPEYIQDSGGTNIVVIRNSKILELVHSGMSDNKLNLKEQLVDKVYESQAGNYRHRQEGLSVRINDAKQFGVWHPTKRVDETTFDVPDKRKKIYLLRSKISEASHQNFQHAKQHSSFSHFILKMMPYVFKYYWLNRSVKGMLKITYEIVKYFQRKFLH